MAATVTIDTPASGAVVSSSPGLVPVQVQVADWAPSDVLAVRLWRDVPANAGAAAWDNINSFAMNRVSGNGELWAGDVSAMVSGQQITMQAFVQLQSFAQSQQRTISVVGP